MKKKKFKKKKPRKKEPEEESELEKEIKETEKEIEEPQFEENARMKSLSEEIKAPVLERVNISEAPSNLEGGIISERAPVKNQEKKEQPFNYSIKGNKDEEETKYQTTYEHATFEFHPHSEIEESGKIDIFPRKEVGIKTSPESAPTETNFEKYEITERLEKENLGKNIFERKEVKYRPFHS